MSARTAEIATMTAPNAATAVVPCTSLRLMVSMKYCPIPFQAKICSVIIAPVKIPGTENATEVATGMMEVRKACLRMALPRSEEHTSELQSRFDLVCRLLLETKKMTSERTTW